MFMLHMEIHIPITELLTVVLQMLLAALSRDNAFIYQVL